MTSFSKANYYYYTLLFVIIIIIIIIIDSIIIIFFFIIVISTRGLLHGAGSRTRENYTRDSSIAWSQTTATPH